jgi:hypothetical protein
MRLTWTHIHPKVPSKGSSAHTASALLRCSFDGGAAITFKPLVQALELLGWQRDQDLLAHVYDFRWAGRGWVRGGSVGLRGAPDWCHWRCMQQTGLPHGQCGWADGHDPLRQG